MSESKPHLAFALEYPIAYGGGVSVIVRTLLQALREEFRLSLISPDSEAELGAAGIAPLLEHHLCWQRERASAARARELADRLIAWQCDLAHFHAGGNYGWGNRRPGTSPFPQLRRAGVRCVTTVHLIVSLLADLLPPDSRWWAKSAAAPIAWLGKMHALSGIETEIAVSDHDLAHLRRWYLPCRRKFRRIYHSQLPDKPAPAAEREKVILHAGHRAARKGQQVLVQAFAAVASRFPEWQLRLVGPAGTPHFEESLRAVIEAHGLQSRVEIEGNRSDAAQLMARAAVYVQPSLHEALGLSLQEALFHGCACVGTQAGGIPELIEHDANGLLVPAGDAAALAAALERLLSDAALRERLGRAGPPAILARGMTARVMVQAHRALYRELLHGR